jgi:hypothetical protein
MNYKIYDVDEKENNSIKKNQILKQAKEEKIDVVFIKQNDLEIIDNSIIDKYLDLIDKYKTPFVMYGFYDKVNCLFNGNPNPNVIVKLNEKNDIIYINRIITKGFIGIDIRNNSELFDENLKIYDTEEYVYRLISQKIMPFEYGFFIDVFESWKFFKQNKKEFIMPENVKEHINNDKQVLKSKNVIITPSVSVENLMQHLSNCNKNA